MFCIIAITIGVSLVAGVLGLVLGYVSNMFWMKFREEGMKDKTLLFLIVPIIIAQHLFGIGLLFLGPHDAFSTEPWNILMMSIIVATYYACLLIGAVKFRRLVHNLE